LRFLGGGNDAACSEEPGRQQDKDRSAIDQHVVTFFRPSLICAASLPNALVVVLDEFHLVRETRIL
jgi:hypothetical protein